MASRVTVNVSLTPSLRRLVDGKVASGRYQSASEVFREALRLLEQHDRLRRRQLKKVREQIEIGLSEARRGELLDGEQIFEALVRPARSRRKRA
jgi:antitoxin ParD1/3/4